MNKNCFNPLLLFLFATAGLLLFIACEYTGGGPCEYDIFDGYIVIDSFSIEGPSEVPIMSFSLFREYNNEEVSLGTRLYKVWGSACNDLLSVGDTLSVTAKVITKGTCTPIELKFLDYPECFNSDW